MRKKRCTLSWPNSFAAGEFFSGNLATLRDSPPRLLSLVTDHGFCRVLVPPEKMPALILILLPLLNFVFSCSGFLPLFFFLKFAFLSFWVFFRCIVTVWLLRKDREKLWILLLLCCLFFFQLLMVTSE